MPYCIFCTQGQMTPQEFRKECGSECWLPILIFRNPGDQTIVVPVFESREIAKRFARKNLPRDWYCGTLNMRMRDAEWMDNRGWRAIKYNYPHKMTDKVEFDIEILEFEPDYKMTMKIGCR